MTKAKRNFLLEMIEGPRTYVPPPNTMILELIDQEKTKGGLLIPEAHQGATGGGMKPLGKVIFVGRGRDTWKDEEPPAGVGDYVLFTPEMYPVVDIHDSMALIHFDAVMLRICTGLLQGEGVGHVPETEAPLYKDQPVAMGSPPTLVVE